MLFGLDLPFHSTIPNGLKAISWFFAFWGRRRILFRESHPPAFNSPQTTDIYQIHEGWSSFRKAGPGFSREEDRGGSPYEPEIHPVSERLFPQLGNRDVGVGDGFPVVAGNVDHLPVFLELGLGPVFGILMVGIFGITHDAGMEVGLDLLGLIFHLPQGVRSFHFLHDLDQLLVVVYSASSFNGRFEIGGYRLWGMGIPLCLS